jgi:phenylacetate-CoA ligase
MERFKGNRIRTYLKELERSQYYSRNELEALQEAGLKRLLRCCVDSVPAYQSLRCHQRLIEDSPRQALLSFPVLSKTDFAANSGFYLNQDADPGDLIPNRTGGSTGEPVQFFLDRPTLEHFEAARWRGLSWWGIGPGDPSIMIWGSPIELTRNQSVVYRLKERFLKNRIAISAYDLNPSKITQYLDTMERFRPGYVYGYASTLAAFSQLMLEADRHLNLSLKGIVSTAENLYQHQREMIEQVFQAPTVNEYGARDGGIIAYQCPAGNMHVSDENLVIEIIDIHTGRPVKKGEEGMVTITDLNNFSMPRLRYQIGDIARLAPSECSCGRHLQVLQNIEGRVDDTFVSREGNLIHGHYWNHIARNMAGIKQFQLIQHDPENLTLRIVKNELFDPSEVELFTGMIIDALGVKKVQVDYCEEIKPSSSGKIRYAIREYPIKV